MLYTEKVIIECANLLDDKDKDDFKNFLEGNKFSICNMFITKPEFLGSTAKKCSIGLKNASIIVINIIY